MDAGRAAIVSGGTYGIGRAITLELARRGWAVVAFGLETLQPGSRAQDGIAGTRAALGAAALDADLLEADVSSTADVERVVAHAVARHGGVAAVVNNAAIRPTGTVLETDPATFDRVLAVNVGGVFRLCRAALPHLRRGGGGAIVNIGSGAALGTAGLAAYSASKAALQALTLAMSHDHAADGIRVNLVVPGPGTASGMVEAMGREAGADPRASQRSPLPVAIAVADLLSAENGDATGRVVEVAEPA